MKNKSILIVGIIIALILIIGAFLFLNSDNPEDSSDDVQFQVGLYNFSLPEGYNVTDTANDTTKISNGYNTVAIFCHDSDNVKKFVNQYVSKKESEGKEIILSNFTVKKTVVYKTELANDTGVVHYWFKKGNNTYSMYSMDANKNTDKLVTQLIKSMNKTQ